MRALIVLFVLLATVATVRAEPDAQQKATARQVLITLRILAYDRVLAERSRGDAVTIAIVSGSTEAGRAQRELWKAGFGLVPRVKVGGRPVRIVAFDYESRGAFDQAIAKHAPAAVIVTGDLGRQIADIQTVTRARRSLTISQDEASLRRGLSVGLIRGEERDEILINLEASRAEGARFGAGLLQLARLVEESP